MIDGQAFGLIEVVGAFGLLLAALGWQWVSIRRTLRADREETKRKTSPPPGP